MEGTLPEMLGWMMFRRCLLMPRQGHAFQESAGLDRIAWTAPEVQKFCTQWLILSDSFLLPMINLYFWISSRWPWLNFTSFPKTGIFSFKIAHFFVSLALGVLSLLYHWSVLCQVGPHDFRELLYCFAEKPMLFEHLGMSFTCWCTLSHYFGNSFTRNDCSSRKTAWIFPSLCET